MSLRSFWARAWVNSGYWVGWIGWKVSRLFLPMWFFRSVLKKKPTSSFWLRAIRICNNAQSAIFNGSRWLGNRMMEIGDPGFAELRKANVAR